MVAWSILNNPSSIIYVYMIIPVPAAVFGVLYIGHEMWGLYNGGTGHANVAHLGNDEEFLCMALNALLFHLFRWGGIWQFLLFA